MNRMQVALTISFGFAAALPLPPARGQELSIRSWTVDGGRAGLSNASAGGSADGQQSGG